MIKKIITNILQGKDLVLKLTEIVLATIVFFGTAYFSVITLATFLHRDWSSVTTMYDFIAMVLIILLGFEVARLILVHNITVVLELTLLIIARKMLSPDIGALDLVYCAGAFAIIVGVYYLYEWKPLKSLEDLTE
jgi:hypothetical protein